MSQIENALEVLLNWQTDNPEKIKRFIKHFYDYIEYEKTRSPNRRVTYIVPSLSSIDNYGELLEVLNKILGGQQGVENLIIYLLQNDHHYENSDTLTNYRNFKPFPSYLVLFAYLLLCILPKRSRRLFDIFWEYQAKTFPGIYEQSAKEFLEPFIAEGITTEREIQELLIKDWLRWQRAPKDSPYYGAALGPAAWYFPNYSWSQEEKKLEEEWRKQTGKEPKKWGE